MTSPVEICNQALAAVGTRTTIASLDESSNEALQCSLQFESSRDTVLRAAHWGFARRFAAGALLKQATGTTVWDNTQPPPPWLYQYAYPSDCIAMRYVKGQVAQDTGTPVFATNTVSVAPSDTAKWARVMDVDGDIESQTICTNAPLAIFCYTRQVIDINQFDSLAVQALISGVASQIAMALTGDKALVKELAGQANNNIMMARVADANEGVTIIDHVPDWLTIRNVPSMTQASYIPEYGPLFGVI